MYKILTTSLFERNIRRLSKNFPRIKKDLLPLLEQLENEIFEGDLLQEFQALVYIGTQNGAISWPEQRILPVMSIFYLLNLNLKISSLKTIQ